MSHVISHDFPIPGHQGQMAALSLGNQHAIERIFVKRGEVLYHDGMLGGDGKDLEWHVPNSFNEVPRCPQLSYGFFDRYLPETGNADVDKISRIQNSFMSLGT